MTISEAVPAKSRRVRTGERHLKCDEATPDCLNCRKSNRECKRGVRLNFIDLTCKEPPILLPPTDEWSVQFQDESRQIASEYRGGLGRYAKLEQQVATPPREPDQIPDLRRQSFNIARLEQHHGPPIDRRYSTTNLASLQQSTHYREKSYPQSDAYSDGYQSRRNSDASFLALPNPSTNRGYESLLLADPFGAGKEEHHRSQSRHTYRGSDVSTAASVAGMTVGNPPQSFRGGHGPGQSPIVPPDTGMMTPTSDKAGEREYLNSPEELHFMQVFVEEVGVWMDSLDEKKHFSRLVPYHALKCPMLLNALLACGVKQLTVTQQFNDDKALFYYDTATTQLLRSLQNPERNTAECATTAVVLNVYEIMSEKPTQRMSHIAGARALIRECGWNAKSTGLGAACFWLNVGMELLSCLAFNWQTAWEPDQWGVDMDFFSSSSESSNSNNHNKADNNSNNSNNNDGVQGLGHGTEEMWVHRMFFIVAKICNFRANIPKFEKASPHDEQMRLQERYAEWQRLKGMCDTWNDACPRPMHPFGYLYPSQSRGGSSSSGGRPTSLFPNVWLIKRAAIVGRLFYHTAQCLLAQINPILGKDSEEARAVQQHHAHQVCGIVAHTRDRGVASVSIRSLAIVAEVLTDRAEQRECVDILECIDKATGWKLAAVVKNLKRRRRARRPVPAGAQQQHRRGGAAAPPLSAAATGASLAARVPSPPLTAPADRASSMSGQGSVGGAGQMMPGLAQAQAHGPAHAQGQPPPVAAPRPVRLSVNPLSFADFSLPNHPYQNWYEPPSRSSSYKPSQGLL
ncbi:C6 zinc finger domain-containing protein [Apiospora kogelbergensis]|uniref:C6 zinc finger domain-containing protein n=1 Tax=Apiospora kogelbergensis TaxID=1337665 RepID=A0AAW0QIM5_9PEZI